MEDEDGIRHRTVTVNGIRMHVAEKGEGPVVLLLHGFPELWYAWRHQIIALAELGYHAVAPDLRGFGESDVPESPESYTSLHLVGDLVGLLDEVAGSEEEVCVVGHDWGAIVGWYLCLYRPDRVKALVNMSVVFTPRNPAVKPLDALRRAYGDDYYICRFQVCTIVILYYTTGKNRRRRKFIQLSAAILCRSQVKWRLNLARSGRGGFLRSS